MDVKFILCQKRQLKHYIDNVVTKNDKPKDLKDGELWATHSGVMEIAGFKLRCHVLSNGMRVFDCDDVESFFNQLNSEL